MFNQTDYEGRLAQAMREIAGAPDQGWRRTVELRYSQFALGHAGRLLLHAAEVLPQSFAGRVETPIPSPHPDAVRQTFSISALDTVEHVRHLMSVAAGIVAGQTVLKDPVRAEAVLRLYEAAKNAPGKAS